MCHGTPALHYSKAVLARCPNSRLALEEQHAPRTSVRISASFPLLLLVGWVEALLEDIHCHKLSAVRDLPLSRLTFSTGPEGLILVDSHTFPHIPRGIL
jgi:hypothetical protein